MVTSLSFQGDIYTTLVNEPINLTLMTHNVKLITLSFPNNDQPTEVNMTNVSGVIELFVIAADTYFPFSLSTRSKLHFLTMPRLRQTLS